MKMNDLRHTVLILAGILLTTFVVSGWWVSKQVKVLKDATQALQQTQAAHEEAKVQLARIQVDHDRLEQECTIIQNNIKAHMEQMRLLPKHLPLLPFLQLAEEGFNEIKDLATKDEFSGLAQTFGYNKLKRVFDSPAFEAALANAHRSQ
jgi:HAMP domain-containing protein